MEGKQVQAAQAAMSRYRNRSRSIVKRRNESIMNTYHHHHRKPNPSPLALCLSLCSCFCQSPTQPTSKPHLLLATTYASATSAELHRYETKSGIAIAKVIRGRNELMRLSAVVASWAMTFAFLGEKLQAPPFSSGLPPFLPSSSSAMPCIFHGMGMDGYGMGWDGMTPSWRGPGWWAPKGRDDTAVEVALLRRTVSLIQRNP